MLRILCLMGARTLFRLVLPVRVDGIPIGLLAWI